MTFISIGNSNYKFDRLINSILNHLEYLPKPILYQYGYSSKLKLSMDNFEQIDFLNLHEYYSVLNKTTFFVSHLGAGSLLNANKFNLKAIFLSRRKKLNEHLDDHQFDLFEYLKFKKNYKNVFACEKDFSLNLKFILNSNVNFKEKSKNNDFQKHIDKILEDY